MFLCKIHNEALQEYLKKIIRVIFLIVRIGPLWLPSPNFLSRRRVPEYTILKYDRTLMMDPSPFSENELYEWTFTEWSILHFNKHLERVIEILPN